LLHEVTPAATKIAFLLNRANRALAESDEKEARDAARALGVNLLVLDASGQSEIDAAFEILIREQAGALMTNSESLFMVQSNPLAALTARHRVPALYAFRENAIAGGLMSYGSNFLTAARELGLYAGRREAATCRWCSRPSTNFCSTSRPRRHSVSPFLLVSSPSLTR